MKAIRTHGRGGPEQLVYEEVPLPSLEPGDALVQVHATGITPAELTWDATYQNSDSSVRIPSIPGHEVSGVIAAIETNVSGLRVGDPVYGLTAFTRNGAAADYVAVRARDLAPKPRSLTHAESAATPLSALTAWQALFERGALVSSQRILIHGASGGVGTFALQFARWKGAYVVATASTANIQVVRQLGANEIIDYRSDRFEEKVGDLDLVLDPIGGDTRERSWAIIRRGGLLITLPGPAPAGEAERYGVRGMFFIVEPNAAQLRQIAGLIDDGVVRPVISAAFSLARAREAFERGLAAHAPGKIVLQVR
jgi:NADPH:quinone reductase-like Zn-dependent oxidoreductase